MACRQWTRGWILHGAPEGSSATSDTLTLPVRLPSRFWPPELRENKRAVWTAVVAACYSRDRKPSCLLVRAQFSPGSGGGGPRAPITEPQVSWGRVDLICRAGPRRTGVSMAGREGGRGRTWPAVRPFPWASSWGCWGAWPRGGQDWRAVLLLATA